MPEYTFQVEGYESGYESEKGTVYKPRQKIGQGTYARARKFQSDNGKKAKAVLAPVHEESIHFDEAQSKYEFFSALYPEEKSLLIKNFNTYRLVLPFMPGTVYKNLEIFTHEQHIYLFLCAIDALKECHSKGYIVVDLKEDNIHYDPKTKKSYLIDGGLATQENKTINTRTFLQENEKNVESMRACYYHFAPECWSTSEVKATPAMDVYALASMMNRLQLPCLEVDELIQSCLSKKPELRPTLDALKKQLVEILLTMRLHRDKIPSTKYTLDKWIGFSIQSQLYNTYFASHPQVIQYAHLYDKFLTEEKSAAELMTENDRLPYVKSQHVKSQKLSSEKKEMPHEQQSMFSFLHFFKSKPKADVTTMNHREMVAKKS